MIEIEIYHRCIALPLTHIMAESGGIRKGDKLRIGFIGLGLMGKPMALHLLEKGYPVCVFNRNKASVNELVARGAKAAESPSHVAQDSDVVIDMVTDAPDVEQVLLQEAGVIESARKGLIVVDMSTNSPETAILVSSQLAEKGVEFLDAPVSGGDKGAREATLTIMVGGKKEVFDACRPIFQVMGKEIVYMGLAGSGQATKLCNQVAVALHTLATCEALLLGSSYDLPTKDLLRVLTNGAASSWNLINLGPRVVARDFEPGFKAAHLHKDLKSVMRVAEAKHLALPGSATVLQLFNAVMAEKSGEKGTQVVARILEKLAEREIS